LQCKKQPAVLHPRRPPGEHIPRHQRRTAHWVDFPSGTIIPAGVQGNDWYAYVNNNPMRYTDPSGHMAWDGSSGNGNVCTKKKGCDEVTKKTVVIDDQDSEKGDPDPSAYDIELYLDKHAKELEDDVLQNIGATLLADWGIQLSGFLIGLLAGARIGSLCPGPCGKVLPFLGAAIGSIVGLYLGEGIFDLINPDVGLYEELADFIDQAASESSQSSSISVSLTLHHQVLPKSMVYYDKDDLYLYQVERVPDYYVLSIDGQDYNAQLSLQQAGVINQAFNGMLLP